MEAGAVTMNVKLQINSGMEHSRIIDWLEQELGVQALESGVYQLPGCMITLEPLPAGTGVLQLPRMLVSFCGEADSCQAFQRQFRLRFLSAGG